uniref:Pentatricopeptide repeat n=1 Tax=Medicago truncatula TaxID=3880 RepID=A2Q3R4_MEDTR|nr:Pentatricopeptide repeat [Medicago truncatula]
MIFHSKQNPSFEIHDLFEKLLEGVDVVENKKHYLAILRAFDVFAKACVGLNMFDGAFDFLFHFQVTRFEILPSIVACNFLINRLIQHDKVKMALEVYKEIKRVGLCPNHHTYAIVIKGLCKNSDDLKHVEYVFDEMEEAGVTPNSYCYAAYIEGLCKNNMSDVGYKLLERCRASNAPIEVYAYAAAIRGFCNEMKLDKAEDVFYDMKSWGLVPDFHVYSPLTRGYCKINDGLRARSLHDDMISKVVDLFKEIKQSCLFLDGVAYNIVLDSLCKLGKVDDAVSTLEELTSMNIDLDIKHYTTLINGYCLQGKTVEAQCLFKEMEEKGFKPDVVAYNVLAAGLFRKDLDSEVIDLLIYMDSQGVKPNSTTHKIIIEGYCSVGKVGEAEAYFNRMKNESVELYTAMVNGYCEANLIEKSYDLFLSCQTKDIFQQKVLVLRNLAK